MSLDSFHDTPGLVAYAPCFQCKRVFPFNPERVPSVVINVRTGKALDDFDAVKPPIEDRDRRPLCRPCFDNLNQRRVQQGLEAIPLLEGAYEPQALS